MDSLLSKINTRMNYIRNNSDNALINKQVNVIENKIAEIKERKYTTPDTINYIVYKIINQDVPMMRGVPGQTNMVYKKMQELADFVSEIPSLYFE